MHDGRWTLHACSVDEVGALARALGVSEITAGVLVRRGYADPALAAAFLAGEHPPHDPFLLGDMRTRGRADPRRDRARRRASASTATTTSTASARRPSRC